jgi:hypothetical protein
MIQSGLHNFTLKKGVPLFCSNNFTGNKCIFRTLSVPQHVSARGVFVVVIIRCCDNNYKDSLKMALVSCRNLSQR